MKHRLFTWPLAIAAVLLQPAITLAAPYTPEKEIIDGRYEGYATSVTLPAVSTAVTWLLLVGLGVLCVSVMFKNAHRTHLD